MRHGTIPIRPDAACVGAQPVQRVPPSLQGDPAQLDALLSTLQQQVDHALGSEQPLDTWLRALHVGNGEAHLQLAPGLACRGLTIASLAFDLLRSRLPDTDIYVGESP